MTEYVYVIIIYLLVTLTFFNVTPKSIITEIYPILLTLELLNYFNNTFE